MRVSSLVAARPNTKMALVVLEFRRRGVDPSVVHTGQHDDAKMSDEFFEQAGMRGVQSVGWIR
jgi:UDP-N-acetylglucosamine 2-epimerase (non-hydrolysing)